MNQQGARRISIVLGVLMVGAMALSTILPLFTGTNTTLSGTVEPTTLPSPTFPLQPADYASTIQFTTDYLHPTGLFSVKVPTGWTVTQPTTNSNSADVSMNNGTLQSVVQVSVGVPVQPITTVDQLSASYSTATLLDSWRNYRSPRELSRRTEGDKLLIDFEVRDQNNRALVARQESWTDGQWIYSVRVVTPDTMIDLLKFVLDKVSQSVKPNKQFAGIPADWNGYFDQLTGYIIRYPATWQLVDSGLGRPASISGDKVALRVEAQSGVTVNDDAAARKWVDNVQPGATIASVKPVDRAGAKGFQVAYGYITPDGDKQSGAALLLNGPDKALHAANLRLLVPDIDLNSDAAQKDYADTVKVLGSFQALGGLNLPPPPTATPYPTIAFTPTLEVTPAVTSAPTAEATTKVEATAVPTAEVTAAKMENTPEATAKVEATVAKVESTPEATATAEATVSP